MSASCARSGSLYDLSPRNETRATRVASIARGRTWLDELIADPKATTASIAAFVDTTLILRSGRRERRFRGTETARQKSSLGRNWSPPRQNVSGEARQLRAICKCPGNRAVRKSEWWRTQSVSNPSPHPKFPANREKNREYCNFGATSRNKRPRCPMISRLSARIPYAKEQGISGARTGIFRWGSGNFSC